MDRTTVNCNQDNALPSAREVVLILRIVLDRSSQLQRGELWDVQGNRQGRFRTVAEVGELVNSWLDQERRAMTP